MWAVKRVVSSPQPGALVSLEEYLTDVHAARLSGAATTETSYHPALAHLPNEAGKTRPLKPRVRCVLKLANRARASPTAACHC